MKFIIIDWMSNVCFHGREFDDFEDAWGFIYEQFPNEECFDDYFVVKAKALTEKRFLHLNDPRQGLRVQS